MANNNNLRSAQKAKKDEFYTMYKDVKEECDNYLDQFKNKVIYCNCDGKKSNFVKYFLELLEEGLIKKLIATHYEENSPTYSLEATKEDGEIKINETTLKGNGDFRSPECLDFLQQSDIVVTNPPFSLFREFINVMTKSEKDFLILGNNNGVSYRNVFPLIKEKKIRLGYNCNKTFEFMAPEHYEG